MANPFDRAVRVAQRTIQRAMGVCVTYSAAGHDPVAVQGVFDSAHVSVELGDGGPVDSVGPAVTLVRADLPADPLPDDRVSVAGAEYRVKTPEPDGHGGVLITLTRTG